LLFLLLLVLVVWLAVSASRRRRRWPGLGLRSLAESRMSMLATGGRLPAMRPDCCYANAGPAAGGPIEQIGPIWRANERRRIVGPPAPGSVRKLAAAARLLIRPHDKRRQINIDDYRSIWRELLLGRWWSPVAATALIITGRPGGRRQIRSERH
jgi:hypothetical protein